MTDDPRDDWMDEPAPEPGYVLMDGPGPAGPGFDADRAWIVLSWILLAGSLAAWPISALTFARHEPQTVLGLSWVAITISALGALVAAKANRRVGRR